MCLCVHVSDIVCFTEEDALCDVTETETQTQPVLSLRKSQLEVTVFVRLRAVCPCLRPYMKMCAHACFCLLNTGVCELSVVASFSGCIIKSENQLCMFNLCEYVQYVQSIFPSLFPMFYIILVLTIF